MISDYILTSGSGFQGKTKTKKVVGLLDMPLFSVYTYLYIINHPNEERSEITMTIKQLIEQENRKRRAKKNESKKKDTEKMPSSTKNGP